MEEEEKEITVAGERSDLPGPRVTPWLVFHYGNNGKYQAFINLFEPNNKVFQRKIIEISCKLYWQKPSHQGWLVILCNDDDDDGLDSTQNWKFGDSFLWNPSTLETIKLPTLVNWVNSESTQYILTCVLSSPPTNLDSMVFFLFAKDDDLTSCQLVFCRLGEEDKYWRWRTKEFSMEEEFQGLVCFEGNKLYIFCKNNKHLEIEIRHGSNCIGDNDDDETVLIRSFDVNNDIRHPLVIAMGIFSRIYYVESCDELFMVRRYSHPRNYMKEVIAFQVLRMNFSLRDWEEVKDLGDLVLFFGKRTRACCSAADLGLTRGCVFFTMPEDKSLYKFDLEDGTISVYLPCPDLPTPWFSPDWMIVSTTIRVVDGQRKPEDTLSNGEKEDIIIGVEEIETSIKNDDKEEEVHLNNRERLEEIGTWGTLHKDIVELIASYLHPIDYLHFRAVCKGNQSAIPLVSWKTSSAEITQTTFLSPWLISYKKIDANYKFLNPMHNNEKFFMNLHDLLLDAEIRFSKSGWLLMSKGKRSLFFFNPFTRARIQLPDLPDGFNYSFSGISFSSLPTSSDCVVFAIGDMIDEIFVFYISRAFDSWRCNVINWSNLPLTKECTEYIPCYNNPVFHNGVFYCLDYKGALGAFSLNDDFTWNFLANPRGPCNSIHQSFLVECEGKLLSVFLGHLGKWVKIFRLDFSKMVWVKVESLGQHMLFISNTSCLSAVAPNSRMKNKIYFPRFHGEEIIFYSLDTGRFQSLASQYSAQDFYNTKEQLYCSWIIPNWSQTKDQELHWQLAHTEVNVLL